MKILMIKNWFRFRNIIKITNNKQMIDSKRGINDKVESYDSVKNDK